MDPEMYANWERDHPHAFPPEEQKALKSRVRKRLPAFGSVRWPAQALACVYSFIKVYSWALCRDLQMLVDLCGAETVTDNGASSYERPDTVLEQLDCVFAALKAHEEESSGLFGRFQAALWLPGCPHPQEIWIKEQARKIRATGGQMRLKWGVISGWKGWMRKMVDTPCSELHLTIRNDTEDMLEYTTKLRKEKVYDSDMAVLKLRAEVVVVDSRTSLIEALGDPRMLSRDMRSIFWRKGLEYPDGLEDYHRSITYQQAVAMDLFDANPVYSWEGQRYPTPARPGNEEAEEEERRRLAALKEAEEAAANLKLRRKAVTIAANMTFQGCSICSTNSVTWVGVGKGAGCESIIVCEACLPNYKFSKPVERLYDWFEIRKLIDENPGYISTQDPDYPTESQPRPAPDLYPREEPPKEPLEEP